MLLLKCGKHEARIQRACHEIWAQGSSTKCKARVHGSRARLRCKNAWLKRKNTKREAWSAKAHSTKHEAQSKRGKREAGGARHQVLARFSNANVELLKNNFLLISVIWFDSGHSKITDTYIRFIYLYGHSHKIKIKSFLSLLNIPLIDR